ncbi:MAG: aspartate 1-decarboxylase [Halobacteriovoraceae bacterium]|nr:aspartate 1-decarboxylase [Halobacteriovoraceae bacterium]|tara:strand:+ start:13614 stop:13964 length:351 start_codon:yes stop_codon:yes gene_type:complete
MQIQVLKSKIHRATVTDANLNYEGSISIDPALTDAARMHEFEKVEIYNCNNGARFATYIIPGGPGEICLNGAAARHAHPGDLVIICAYGTVDNDKAAGHKPTLVFVDEKNTAKSLS